MRILVLQLARFGDIYQTWPCLRALQRHHPGAEIHVLVRARFRAALTGLSFVQVHELPTAEILAPIFENADDTAALARLTAFTEALPCFDRIINLSYSPFSSYLTDTLSGENTQVRGYTRHSDGFFAIPDDTSAYFYAQVGIGRANRYHLTEVFAAVAEVELQDSDFAPAASAPRGDSILIHLGASQVEKSYPAELWIEALRNLRSEFEGQITLIGSQDEVGLATTVTQSLPELNNQVGKTQLDDVMKQLSCARLLIGADSAPVHMAALTGTPVLNLSCSTVNFYETGPLTAGSRILYAPQMSEIPAARVSEEIRAMLCGQGPQGPCYVRETRSQAPRAHAIESDDFAWDLIQALYTGTPYPKAVSGADRLAFQRLFELAELALQHIANWDVSGAGPQVLSTVDQMLSEIPRLCPNVEPVVQWFQTQRLRLGPDVAEATLVATRRLFEELLWITAVYREESPPHESAIKAIGLAEACVPELREYDFFGIEPQFQRLISLLHELARHSTNVAEVSWSSVLTEIEETLARRDFIRLADVFEYELTPALRRFASRNETIGPDVVF
ncbi:MAG: glycosyltransferase family 9 protein [Bdellovibrionales bacterium]|nr:glycosyltransferase family 9 protein [Bdellovibrionales bacterium]